MKLLKCEGCGKDFESKRKKRFCNPKCRTKKTSSSKKQLNSNQIIIEKFIKEPKKIWANRPVMMRELSFCKVLIKKYGEEFWLKAKSNFKVISLSWFFSSRGREYLHTEKAKLNLDFTRERVYSKKIENEPPKKFKKIKKTLLDYLR